MVSSLTPKVQRVCAADLRLSGAVIWNVLKGNAVGQPPRTGTGNAVRNYRFSGIETCQTLPYSATRLLSAVTIDRRGGGMRRDDLKADSPSEVVLPARSQQTFTLKYRPVRLSHFLLVLTHRGIRSASCSRP
jgi:hypothetical protein